MWIIPKQLHALSGAPDTEAFLLDLNEQSQACGQSLLVRSKPSPARTWLLKWKRDSWTQHLFGRILKPSHVKNFEIVWTSLWRVIPANPSAQQANASEPKTPDTSGPTSFGQLELFAPECASSRMSRDTLVWDSAKSSETWEQQVTRRRGEYSQRLKSGRLTSARGSLSWPTVTTAEAGKISNQRNHGQIGLSNHPAIRGEVSRDKYEKGKHGQAAPATPSTDGSRQELWLTPRANEPDSDPGFAARNDDRGAHCHGTLSSQVKVKCWATPQASDPEHSGPNQRDSSGRPALPAQALQWATPRSGKTTDENPETWAKRQAQGDVATMPLTAQVKCWLTPKVPSGGGQATRGTEGGGRRKLEDQTEALTLGKLNPRWVETLMGLPVGWVMPSCKSPVTIAQTNSDSSATESCRPRQSELF